MLLIHRPIRLLGLILAGLIAGNVEQTWAQDVDTRLSIEFHRRFQELRTGSPISIDWTLIWKGTGQPRGHLEVQILDGQKELGTLRTVKEQVLTSSGNRFRTLLPTFYPEQPLAPLDIQAYFVSDEGLFDLGERSLRVAGASRRTFIIAFCDSWQQIKADDEREELTHSLDLKRFVVDQQQDHLATYPARVFPDDIPVDPLWLCEYNIVVLFPDGFRELRLSQLEGLARWVDAGGSLCVFVSSTLSRPHVEFLNGLTRAPSDQPLVSLDDTGRAMCALPVVRIARGLGHVVVTDQDPHSRPFVASSDWKAAASFLWKRLAGPRHTSSNTSAANRLQRTTTSTVKRPLGTEPTIVDLSSRERKLLPGDAIKWKLTTLGSLLARLTPDDFEVVPLWLLGCLLVGYLVVIGPVDYFLLGLFRQRRLTWLYFPLVTIGLAMMIIWISHDYMATNKGTKSVIFRDVGDQGKVVRENRFELLLNAMPTVEETRIQHALFTPIDHRRFLSETNSVSDDPFSQVALETDQPTHYVGTIPANFIAVQETPQWSPQLNRIFVITPQAPAPSFDWDSVRFSDLTDTRRSRDLLKRLQATFGNEVLAIAFHGPGPPTRVGAVSPLFPAPDQWGIERRLGDTGGAITDEFLQDVCVRPAVGIFNVVSQISPHGGDNLEDLPLLDPTDPTRWLLVVAIPGPRKLVVYRKLYFRNS